MLMLPVMSRRKAVQPGADCMSLTWSAGGRSHSLGSLCRRCRDTAATSAACAAVPAAPGLLMPLWPEVLLLLGPISLLVGCKGGGRQCLSPPSVATAVAARPSAACCRHGMHQV